MKYFDFEEFKDCNAIAIFEQEKKITFNELYNRCHLLECKLLNRGIGYQDRVGILLNNSIEYVVAVMACIKIKAVSIIFPYCISNEHLQYMFEVSLPDIFVTDKKWQLLNDKNYINLNDDSWEGYIPTSELEKNVVREIAYIIYTSGSTGMPKGVVIAYQALNNYVEETISKMDINKSSRILVTSPFSFDAALGYIYAMLKSRASLVLLNEKILLPRLIYESMRRYQVTHYACTPSFLCNLIKYIMKKGSEGFVIKTLSFGAENTYQNELQTIKWFKANNPGIRLFNRYGPTETTIVVSSSEIFSDSKDALSIGLSYKNVEFYVLDDNMMPVKEGKCGELYIAGIQLMEGYYNDKQLTENAICIYDRKRVFRTFDLFEYHAEGNIFLGRNDDMLKRDGKRIYLSEIENIVSQIKGITDSICVIDKSNNSILAYLVADDEDCCLESLKQVKESYPAYMIPNSIKFVNEIPKTLNGKRNRSIIKDEEKTNEVYVTWN